ncbi:MAG TPA: Asp23/Gls24 family envelope stress response protein [Candidatus Faecousia faecigallinarum]|nr:Asp23/Gls24 family envelope stress response protein [Candidatus Faecousia faecigallinarum]
MAENKQYITQNQENGAILIAEDVLVSIVTVAVNETEGVSGLNTKLGADISDILNKKNRGKGVKITITEEDKLLIECNIIVTYGSAVVSVAKAVQDNVTAAVESMTGITPAEINVNICGITVEQK